MRLIKTSTELNAAFERLFAKYRYVSMAVAWASDRFESYKLLLANRRKIKRCVVGIHFFQTQPGFIKAFLTDKRVRFVKQPNGVFHPKLYLFENDEGDWECLLGSPNFTKGAFTQNSEAAVLFASNEDSTGDMRADLDSLLDEYWKDGNYFKQKEFEAYERKYELFRPKMRPFMGDFGEEDSGGSILTIPILNISWNDYFKRVEKDKQGLTKRIKVLATARRFFRKYDRLSSMPKEARIGIAGLRDSETVPWGWFGSMRVTRTFGPLFRQDDRRFSDALDFIPLLGEVTKNQYDRYIKTYLKAFPEGKGHGLATATRLLALKRPDYFLCLDGQNRDKLCAEFETTISRHDYDGYWNKAVQRIMVADWWMSPRPRDRQEAQIWDGRAAFLDSIYYDPDKG